jgi:hypothetical protein
MIKRLQDLSAAHLRRATQIKEKIEKLERELGILGIPEAMTVGGTIRRHRTMSASARKRISEAMKARSAKQKSGRK